MPHGFFGIRHLFIRFARLAGLLLTHLLGFTKLTFSLLWTPVWEQGARQVGCRFLCLLLYGPNGNVCCVGYPTVVLLGNVPVPNAGGACVLYSMIRKGYFFFFFKLSCKKFLGNTLQVSGNPTLCLVFSSNCLPQNQGCRELEGLYGLFKVMFVGHLKVAAYYPVCRNIGVYLVLYFKKSMLQVSQKSFIFYFFSSCLVCATVQQE